MARGRLPRPLLDKRPRSVPLLGHRVTWVAVAVVRLPLHRAWAGRVDPLSAARVSAAVVRYGGSSEHRARVPLTGGWVSVQQLASELTSRLPNRVHELHACYGWVHLSIAFWKSWMAWGMGVRDGSRGLPGTGVVPVGSVKISPTKVTSSWMKMSDTAANDREALGKHTGSYPIQISEDQGAQQEMRASYSHGNIVNVVNQIMIN